MLSFHEAILYKLVFISEMNNNLIILTKLSGSELHWD